MYRSRRVNTNSPRGNQRSWNGQKSHQLGENFVFNNKPCFACGSFDHLSYECDQFNRVIDGKSRYRDNSPKRMIPRSVILNSGNRAHTPERKYVRLPLNISKERIIVNHDFTNQNRPFIRNERKKAIWVPKVATEKATVSTVKKTVSTERPSVGKMTMGYGGNAVKASARWVWKPKEITNVQNPKPNGVSTVFKRFNYIDTQGRPKSVMAWVPKEN